MPIRLSKSGKRIGRPPGAINKKTEELKKLLEQQPGMGPLEFLHWVVNNRRLSMELRIKAAADLAPFVAPKLSAVAVRADIETREITQKQTRVIMANPELADAAELLAIGLLNLPTNKRIEPPQEVIDVSSEPAAPVADSPAITEGL